ncbi:hypothetical protein KIN20_032898 [Parelaphostrongylus tenuis]|uniref:Uncharacterized protein n=1 Tax=Parelaphostrongylus tenuis TaxID=148309 RepID=A0AAD5WHT5_PARTN|nr:hypothetical protein KIN20_032898 [Parelaphostrongylus tenuis]
MGDVSPTAATQDRRHDFYAVHLAAGQEVGAGEKWKADPSRRKIVDTTFTSITSLTLRITQWEK